MKIGFYSHNIDFAGTWRSHERLAESLQHNPNLSIDIFYSPDVENNRLEVCRSILSKCNFISFQRSHKKTGPVEGYSPLHTNFDSVVKSRALDVLHFARSGYYEWPFNQRLALAQIETNIFGYVDSSPYLDGTIYIAKCLGLKETAQSKLIPNPIAPPSLDYSNLQSLRKDLAIDDDTLVFGRIGRPANFSPISLEAYSIFRNYCKSKYIVIGGCDDAKLFVKRNGMENDVIFLDCTNDDVHIERFHKTIDIFAHYRSDGEICSTAISQAMLYGIPVITHYAGKNGQAEWLGEGGICVSSSQEYFHAMANMVSFSSRQAYSSAAKTYASFTFDQALISKKVLDFYFDIVRLKS